MKKIKKSNIYSLIGTMLLAMLWMAPANISYAEEPTITESQRIYSGNFNSGVQTVYITLDNISADAEILNLKSSNTSIATARQENHYYYDSSQTIIVYFQKPGTVKISFQIKQKEIIYEFKETYTMKKATNPCKSFKVGGQDYSSKIWKSGEYTILNTMKKRKISIKPKNGWKVKNIHINIWNDSYSYQVNKRIKNGKSINLRGKNARILAEFEHKKTGVVIHMQLNVTS